MTRFSVCKTGLNVLLDEKLCACFLVRQTVFDCVDCNKLVQISNETGMDRRERRLIRKL